VTRHVSAGCQTCASVLYKSSPLSGPQHEFNAWKKAVALGRAHSEATDHEVTVTDGRTVSFLATRCGFCQQHTPRNATGACGPCAVAQAARLDALLKENV
jgi:hypothetical protein